MKSEEKLSIIWTLSVLFAVIFIGNQLLYKQQLQVWQKAFWWRQRKYHIKFQLHSDWEPQIKRFPDKKEKKSKVGIKASKDHNILQTLDCTAVFSHTRPAEKNIRLKSKLDRW